VALNTISSPVYAVSADSVNEGIGDLFNTFMVAVAVPVALSSSVTVRVTTYVPSSA